VVQTRADPASKLTNAMPFIWVFTLGLGETLGHRMSKCVATAFGTVKTVSVGTTR
jgi:hypothetical protein